MHVKELALSIAEELKANPSAWHQGWFDNNDPMDKSAPTGWCLSGHMLKRDIALGGEEYRAFTKHINGQSVCTWNDSAGRTVEDVIKLCEQVAAAA